MIETATFVCSICAEPSEKICAYCTKDTCSNHFCIRCKRCSDCCECEVPLVEERPEVIPAEPEPIVAEIPLVAEAPLVAETLPQAPEAVPSVPVFSEVPQAAEIIAPVEEPTASVEPPVESPAAPETEDRLKPVPPHESSLLE